MSKPVKELIRKELIQRFEGLTSLAVVGFTGINAVMNRQIRGRLREKNIRMTVVKNAIARQAFEAIGLSDGRDLLTGPCAVAFGSDAEQTSVVDVIRELMDIAKEAPTLTVKAAVLEGEVFGTERIKELSEYPTRPEAQARLVGSVLSPGRTLAACLTGPGGMLASLVKAIQETKETQDESAEKAA